MDRGTEKMAVFMYWETSAALGQGILSNSRDSHLRSLQGLAMADLLCGWLLVMFQVGGSAGDSQRCLLTEVSVALLLCDSNYISRNRGVVGLLKML